MNTTFIVINGCEQHSIVSDGRIRVIATGPDITQAARDSVYDTLTCPECWTRDERAMLALAHALHLTPEDTAALCRVVLRRKMGRNRN